MIDQIIQFFYSLLFIITPILMSKDSSELFEFNKMLFIYIVTVIITFLWFLKMIVNRKIILKKTLLDIPIILFLLSQLLSTIYSIDIHTSIFGYYGRFNGGLLSIVCYITLYYALVSNIVNIEKLLKSIIASSLLVIIWAIPGHFGHDVTCLLFSGQFNNSCWDNTMLAFRPELRAFSTLGQPNWLGAYLAAVFFIGTYFLIKNKNNETMKQSIIMTIYLFLNFSMILFTRSRSALMAVFLGVILFMSYYLFFIKTKVKKFLIILLIVTVLPILLFKTGEDKIDKFFTLKTYQNILIKNHADLKTANYKLQTTNSSSVTESFDIRKIVWQGAWDLGLKYPLFGTGVETFAYSYNFVRPVSHNLTSEWDYVYNKAHNEYLNFLATTGFVGLGAYLLLIFSFQFSVFSQLLKFKFLNKTVIPAKAGIQNKKAWIPSSEGMTASNSELLTLSLFCGWLTILITNFFGFSTTTLQLFFYLIPALVIMGNRQQTETAKFEKVNAYQWLVIFVFTAVTIYFLSSIVVYYLADVNYSYGTKYVKASDQQKAVLYFEKAIKLRYEPVYEDRFSGSLAYLSAAAALQNENDLAKQLSVLSDYYNKKTIKTYPKNIFYWKTKAKNMYYFYQVTRSDNELLQGIEALNTARILYPTDPKIPYSLSLYYTTLYDTDKNNVEKQSWQKLSLNEIDNTIKLKSNYREAYLFKGQLLKKYGMNVEARGIFEYILSNFDKNDQEVIKELQSF